MKLIKNWKLFASLFIIFGPAQYIVLTAVAMLFYAGGTMINPLSPGYFFWGNFFSDLGRVIALSGAPNVVSFTIFTITAIILSLSFIPFALVISSYFKSNKTQYLVARIGSLICLTSIIFLIGTILTPWDIFDRTHLMFANLFNLTGLLGIVFFTIAVLYNKDYPNLYGFVYIALLVIAVIYTIVLISIPKAITLDGLILQASMQKFSQYSFLLCFLIQGYGAWKLQKYKVKL
ncbi:MAG: hypothetical protein HWN80_11115 [Candidatus Lokiarchaeota archaeon]|nr:hypothetical protein [Candidatus Lokiarchaeota archaeon]